ncbi:MAG: hypothetical protein AAGD32_02940, partial [Planctomycetota bacterium]
YAFGLGPERCVMRSPNMVESLEPRKLLSGTTGFVEPQDTILSADSINIKIDRLLQAVGPVLGRQELSVARFDNRPDTIFPADPGGTTAHAQGTSGPAIAALSGTTDLGGGVGVGEGEADPTRKPHVPPPDRGGLIVGDFNNDGVLNAPDIDILLDAERAGIYQEQFDLYGNNGVIDQKDVDHWVWGLASIPYGDLDFDHDRDADGIDIMWKNYTNGLTKAGWADGDVTGDGVVDHDDVLLAKRKQDRTSGLLWGNLDGSGRFYGTVGDDVITGTDGDDIIWGGPGTDTVNANGGDDEIWSSDANEAFDGGTGDDFLIVADAQHFSTYVINEIEAAEITSNASGGADQVPAVPELDNINSIPTILASLFDSAPDAALLSLTPNDGSGNDDDEEDDPLTELGANLAEALPAGTPSFIVEAVNEAPTRLATWLLEKASEVDESGILYLPQEPWMSFAPELDTVNFPSYTEPRYLEDSEIRPTFGYDNFDLSDPLASTVDVGFEVNFFPGESNLSVWGSVGLRVDNGLAIFDGYEIGFKWQATDNMHFKVYGSMDPEAEGGETFMKAGVGWCF